MFTKLRESLSFDWSRASTADEFAAPATPGYEWTGAEVRPRRRWKKIVLLSSLAALAIAVVVMEMRTSWAQSRFITTALDGATFKMEKGESGTPFQTGAGPYDERLGYTRIQNMLTRVKRGGFAVESQTRWSEKLLRLGNWGMFPVYNEKTRAGLRVFDRNGDPLHSSIYPEHAYDTFESIPTLVVRTALFIENREILDGWASRRNPAIEWDRLTKAFVDYGLKQVNHSHRISGGSTLATQLEKIRHSPDGRTDGPREKLRQIASASLRAYREGPNTLPARRQIVKDYLNSVPLAATPAHGEVIGLADGLKDWYDADFQKINRILSGDESSLTPVQWQERALAYRQVLSLLLAINRPTYYLRQDPAALHERGSGYLRVLAAEGVISPKLRDAALNTQATLSPSTEQRVRAIELRRKGTDAVRYALVGLLGLDSLYELDRLDLTVETTLHGPASTFAAETMEKLNDPEFLSENGLVGERMLSPGQGSPVIYSLTLHERGANGNRLLVQLDNSHQALNLNEQSKLELGSTAKLRTLATYLEIIRELHQQLTADKPTNLPIEDPDRLTRWAAEFLLTNTASKRDTSLPAMLEAAMLRTYSASPGEAFYTGGGLHAFANFDSKDNRSVLTVREGFQRSVNLVFIRIMRDIVEYQIRRLPGYSPNLISDGSNPHREKYLARFADREGSAFLRVFFEKYTGLEPDEALEALLETRDLTPNRFAVLYLSVRPQATYGEFQLAMLTYVNSTVPEKRSLQLYEMYAPGKMDWNDRGYVAGIHPLELWLVAYLRGNPQASWEVARDASRQVRQDVYRWLFHSRSKLGKDVRIRSVLEVDAFAVIHQYWKRQGFPFRYLVPSLATAIGSSGDTPAALAELAGIILNNGVRLTNTRVERMILAEGTPFETRLNRKLEVPVAVFLPEVASRLHQEMLGVVEKGTARRAFKSVVLRDGKILEVAGKTGTGDNRVKSFFSVGKARSRTAAFVFTVGDRYFGSLVAYVPGEEAATYKFSSALPVQIFKMIVPGVIRELGTDSTPSAIALNSPVPTRR